MKNPLLTPNTYDKTRTEWAFVALAVLALVLIIMAHNYGIKEGKTQSMQQQITQERGNENGK